MAPFLEVVTRHLATRPRLLRRCSESLAGQTDKDFLHTVLRDEVGEGVEAAQLRLRDWALMVVGQWVWILDDDDECISDTLVEDLKQLALGTGLKLVYTIMEHHRYGQLPTKMTWGMKPREGAIGCSSFFLRADAFRQFAPALDASYEADFKLISAAHRGLKPEEIAWQKKRTSRCTVVSKGAAE